MIVLVALFFLEAAFLVQIFLVWPYSNIFSSILPSVLVDLTNNDRSENNVSALKVNPLLELAAQLKAQDMATKGYFEHTSPEGLTPWFWLQKVGYRWSGAGENLAVNFSDSSDIENAWMNSSGHRANILDNRFSEIGIATAKGIYKGQEAIFVVQFFGRPLVTQAASLKPSGTKPPSAAQTSSQPAVSSTTALEPQSVKKETTSSAPVAGAVAINEETGAAVSQASLWQRFLSMPKTVTTAIYLAFAAVFLLALALKIFVKIKIQYPKLIFNGALVLFVIISLLYFNYLLILGGQPGSGIKIFN